MFSIHELDQIDRDGALQETGEKAGVTRASLLKRAAIGGGAAIGGTAIFASVAGAASTGPSKTQDVAILNYALTLEYLEEAFYLDVLKNNVLKGDLLEFAKVAAADETAHRAFLVKALGTKAVKKPKFNFGAATQSEAKFTATSIALEDTGVSAYAGQGPRLLDKKVVAAALSIHSIEARHAAWIRQLSGVSGRKGSPAPVPFDVAKSMSQVLAVVKSTGFIVG